MKKNAQITLIIIAINFGLIEILFLDESFKKESIDLVIAVSIAWFIGRQYDKM
ncbi:PAS domain-containing sensor histidine kinase, partial [Priestia aryabhattai]|nr:PAS domain-containing sensor histidine kinase [Priestia aryabhattai]